MSIEQGMLVELTLYTDEMRSEFFAKLCFYSRGRVLSNAHIRVSMRPLEVELLRLKELSDRLAETATVLPPTSSWQERSWCSSNGTSARRAIGT